MTICNKTPWGHPPVDTQDASETTPRLAPTIFILLAPLDYPEVL